MNISKIFLFSSSSGYHF